MSTTPAPQSPPRGLPDEPADRTGEVPMSALLAACRSAAAVSTPPETPPETPAEDAEPRKAA